MLLIFTVQYDENCTLMCNEVHSSLSKLLRRLWWAFMNAASWWRHQMEAFSALLAICAQRPVMRSFDVFYDLRLNKRLSKQLWGWWFETLSRPLWRHCNGTNLCDVMMSAMASQITGVSDVYSTICSAEDQRRHQSSDSLASDRWIPRTKGQ